MASAPGFPPLRNPACFNSLLPHSPDTLPPHTLSDAPNAVINTTSLQFLFDISPSTFSGFDAVSAQDFVNLVSSPMKGQSSEHPSWPCPGQPSDIPLQPQASLPAQAPYSCGNQGITGLRLDSRGDSGRHSTAKEDSRSVTPRDSLRKQRVAKESLRRKNMSKWFSKLEVLLPPENIFKFDRCSVIDAAINYIRSLEKTIAEGAQRNDRQKLETPSMSTEEAKYSAPPSTTSPVVDEQGGRNPVVAVTSHLENAFVNVVSSCRTDPTHFSSLLSVLHEHRLEIKTASLSRNGETVVYTAHAKIPNPDTLRSHRLQDQICSSLTCSPRKLGSESEELANSRLV